MGEGHTNQRTHTTVLLIERDTASTLVNLRLLRALGYDVITVKSGREAVKTATGNAPINLVLMSIDLGRGMDGMQAANRILAKRNLPIVFVLSHADKESIERVKGIDRYGYVIKNSASPMLQSSIEMALELFRCREALRESENRVKEEEQKKAEETLLKISTLEKQGLARFLHDGMGQYFAGMAYLCDTLKNQSASAPEKNIAAEIETGLQKCQQLIRTLEEGLLPVDLDASGLPAALQRLTRTVSKTFSVDCRLVSADGLMNCDRNASVQLYYLIQEAVMNAARHGSPRNIVVSFSEPHDKLTVQDDGVGFDLSRVGENGIGLEIMRYRANIIGGKLLIDSRAGAGTRIQCELPIRTG